MESVPKQDVFSYTYQGVDWLNVKWGFEVLQAKTAAFFGAEFLFLPQVIANLLMLFFLLKTTQLFARKNHIEQNILALALMAFFSWA